MTVTWPMIFAVITAFLLCTGLILFGLGRFLRKVEAIITARNANHVAEVQRQVDRVVVLADAAHTQYLALKGTVDALRSRVDQLDTFIVEDRRDIAELKRRIPV